MKWYWILAIVIISLLVGYGIAKVQQKKEMADAAKKLALTKTTTTTTEIQNTGT